MLMIRMARFGAKKKPSYRVVVIDKERARNSRSVEVVGLYNPVSQPQVVNLNHERIAYWMKNGAQPSDTVSRLLKKNPRLRPNRPPSENRSLSARTKQPGKRRYRRSEDQYDRY